MNSNEITYSYSVYSNNTMTGKTGRKCLCSGRQIGKFIKLIEMTIIHTGNVIMPKKQITIQNMNYLRID